MYQSYSEYPLSDHFAYKLYRKHKEPYRNSDKNVLPLKNYNNKSLYINSNTKKIYPFSNSYTPDGTTFLRQFCQDTTVHGLGFAGNLRITKFERILWGIIFLVTSVFLFITMGKFFYSDNSVLRTVIQNASYSIADIPFPSITFCRTSNFNWARYKEAENIFLPKNATTKMRSNFKKYLILYYDLPFAKVYIPQKPTKSVTINSEDLKELDFLNIKDIFDFMAWTCEENFDNCYWHGTNSSCCRHFQRKYTEKGLCFSFNSVLNYGHIKNLQSSTTKGDSGSLHIYLKDDKIFESKEQYRSKRTTLRIRKSVKTQTRISNLIPKYSLPLITNITSNSSRNISGISYEVKNKTNPLAANLNNFIESNKLSTASKPINNNEFIHPWGPEFYVGGDHGYLISINQPLESPNPKTFLNHGSTGIFLIEPTYLSHNIETKYVSSSVRQCLFPFETQDPLHLTLPDHVYNLENCHQECKRQNIYKLCNCVPDIYYPTGNYPRCKPSDYKCLMDNSNIINNIVKIATKDNRSKAIVCYCMSACNRVNYEITKTIDRGPPPFKRKSNQISIKVLYGVDTFIKYETSLSKNWLDYLVYYGGIASFFLGCSLLSFCEVIYYFTIRLIVYLSYKIRYKNIN